MDLLIVGSGGREHALGWKARQSPKIGRIFFAPGNGGTAEIGTNINIKEHQIQELLEFALEQKIDFTLIGPELPLHLGLADVFREHGLSVFGPGASAARLEGSKSFAKAFMDKYRIPTAEYEVYDDVESATRALSRRKYPLVVKADGLAAGKGVVICADEKEALQAVESIMADKIFGEAGERIVLEEFMVGNEASLMCFTDGQIIVPMESAQDYKRALDGDKGLNTGGMGSISPAFHYTPGMGDDIAKKTFEGMRAEGFDYRGVIYIGLMITAQGPKVVEYNVRFGDPETEAVLLRLDTDLVDIITAVSDGKLSEVPIRWKSGVSVCVVAVSGGYPGKYTTGYPIDITECKPDAAFFHAGTIVSDGVLRTSGGRVLMASALGGDVNTARKLAYEAIETVKFKDCHYRKDIGNEDRGKNKDTV